MWNFLSLAGTFLYSKVLPAALLLVLGMLAIRFVMLLVEKLLTKFKLETVAHGLIKTVLRVVLYGLLALMVASKLGIDVTGIVALASVLTLAISLSVQNALTNLISGFTLLYTKPFVVGDYVEIAGQSGSVQTVGLTYTKLSTPDNKSISIPNGAVTSAQIVNYTVLGTRRVEVAVAASYDSAVDDVLEALRQAGSVDTVLEGTEPFAAVKGYGESAVDYILHVWVRSEDYWSATFEINKRIKESFREKGVSMTYPHIHVHMEK